LVTQIDGMYAASSRLMATDRVELRVRATDAGSVTRFVSILRVVGAYTTTS
jgi:hypothetical protein